MNTENTVQLYQSKISPLLHKLQSWETNFYALLPNILLALILFTVFWYFGRLAHKGAKKVFTRSLKSPTIIIFLATAIRVAIVFLGLFFALSILGLDTMLISILAGAGVIGIALGFAFQDLATNLISGFMLGVKKPFELGEAVEVAGKVGKALAIDLRSTTIESADGLITTIPNKEVLQHHIVNYVRSGKRALSVEVGVAYNTDLKKAQEVLKQAVENLKFVLKTSGVGVIVQQLGEKAIVLGVNFWISSPGIDPAAAKSEALLASKTALDANGITIPYPVKP